MSSQKESIRTQTVRGIKWSAVERFTNQGISFVIGIILARLLNPTDYGTIGMIGIFTAIIGSFVDAGFANALIRKLDRTDVDCSTVFYFNLSMSIICYGIMFIAAPYIADFFQTPILKDIIRVICLEIVINAFGAIQTARFTWTIDFRSTARASIIATVISGAIGIFMAYHNCGVWSLVWQTLIFSLVNVLGLWIISRWRPLLVFSWKSFKNMFSFGSKLLVSGLLHTIYVQLDTILIGKFYHATQLGLWSRAKHLVNYPSSNITSILSRVTYPILSKFQNDEERLIDAYRKYIKLSSLIIFFFMMLMFSLARPLVLFLLTAKWESCIIYAYILCFVYMFDHINSININLLYVKGRSDLVLKLEVIKKTISISILFLCIPFGVIWLAVGSVVYCQIAIIFNTYYTGKLFKFGYIDQLKDYMPYFFMAVVACFPSFLLSRFSTWHNIAILITGGIISLIIYIMLLSLFRDQTFLKYIGYPLKNKYLKTSKFNNHK